MKIKLLIERLQELEKSGCANVLIEDGDMYEYDIVCFDKESNNAIMWIEVAGEE